MITINKSNHRNIQSKKCNHTYEDNARDFKLLLSQMTKTMYFLQNMLKIINKTMAMLYMYIHTCVCVFNTYTTF